MLSIGQAVGNQAAFLRQKFPKFVLGFLLISILATSAVFNKKSNSAAWRLVALGIPVDVRRSWPAH